MKITTSDGRLRPPQQTRSKASLDRILDAVETLLDGRKFADLTIQDIVDTADVSRSTFYARFPSKEDLLPFVYLRYLERITRLLDDALDVEPLAYEPEALVERLVRAYLEFVVRFEPMLVSFETGEMGSRHLANKGVITDRVVVLYLRAIGREGDRALATKVDFATRSIAAILMRAICEPSAFAKQIGFDHERLVAETSRMASCYLAEVTDA